ncbi:PD40 domain-containing protein [Flammeovirga yaeyamensis]|uniref:PD40 domain-containing protein n=1 Tax=Flammeovirga yaeyamensis TaxID=367791 RepID=A0AAX1N7N4_9BACT|nr:PD40 domain-containing protein [Flammeovirga yaeyamensis]MBB3699142.1 hypothetical protein [Flammeovirga yaeyamensis]NMF36575.1 hypothetical protein [Flammeovirga yaeyamensis]QWG03469.1 PD40 domain-containing protein [Flammeovirga yaeyamensis]
MNEKYIDAINYFNEYLEANTTKEKTFDDVELRIKQCENGIKLNSVDDLSSETTAIMDIPINTSYDETAPIISKRDNFILFNSNRQVDSYNYVYGDQYAFLPEDLKSKDSDIYLSYRKGVQFSHPYPQFDGEFNTIYPLYVQDGSYMLLYIEYSTDAKGKGNIYETRVKKGRWQKPKKLNSKINSNHEERGAILANNGTTIYFSSNRPGGQGGFDIYKSIRVGKDDWSKPINLGPTINGPNDEVFPFIHNDNKTLYYSTNGVLSMGGFDLVVAKKEGANWTRPKNLGKKVNSPFNELQFSQIPSKRYSYFTSDRQNQQSVGGKDIYAIFKPVHKMKRAIVTGKIKVLKNGVSLPITLLVKDNSDITYKKYVYDPSPDVGKFFMILPPGKNYSITIIYEDVELYTMAIDLPKDTYRYQLDKEFAINEIEVFNKVVGYDVIPGKTKFEITTFDELKTQDVSESTDARYDALLMLMEMIVDRTDKEGLANLNDLDDPVKDLSLVNTQSASNNPDPYYTPLLDLIERAFNEANPDLITSLDSIRGDQGDKVVKIGNQLHQNVIVEERYYFPEKEFDISRDNKASLNELSEFLKNRDNVILDVVWFSKNESNKTLSTIDQLNEMRMNSILNYLSAKGVSRWQYQIKNKQLNTSKDNACILLSVRLK